MSEIVLEDESLRDGLQSEKRQITLEDKIDIFKQLHAAGVPRVQVGSFVHPKWVPQMADTDEFVGRIDKKVRSKVSGLVLNAKGLERALTCGIGHISLSASVSDSHSIKNVRKPSQKAVDEMVVLIHAALDAGLDVRAGVQCAFGCVYEGSISEDRVVAALRRMVQAGAREVNLADTTGMANPRQVKRVVDLVRQALPDTVLSLHLHDTRGLGIANMIAGYEAGVRSFDTCAAGLGGCPFVADAAGNIPTEDAVHAFEAMGIDTGIDLDKICAVAQTYERLLQKRLPGRMNSVLKALS